MKSGKAANYIPDRGDIVWISMPPQAGHEQAGRRPALVISPKRYNDKVGLALMCPITSRIKGYPFEVVLPGSMSISGAVLSDQIRSLDWRARNAELIEKMKPELVKEVTDRVVVLVDEEGR